MPWDKLIQNKKSRAASVPTPEVLVKLTVTLPLLISDNGTNYSSMYISKIIHYRIL